MRGRLGLSTRYVGALIALLTVTTLALSAPPKSRTVSEAKQASEDLPAEIPAVPFLTVALIRDPSVRDELGLKPKQRDAVDAAIAEIDEPLWRVRDVPVKQVANELDALLAKLNQQLKRELTPPQQQRFEQIVLQARGWKALASADLVSRLNLSADQTTRLRAALAASVKERVDMEKEIVGQSPNSQEQARSKLRKAEAARFTAILTSKQQSEFSSLLGKGFDLSRVIQVGCVAPELRDVTAWINSEPITLKQLRGNVVVVHFWAFGCINCVRNLPHYQSWQDKYAKSGVTIIGIQTPETDSERKLENLQRNVIERKIEYPVILDGNSENWKAWGTNMWPSVYLIDKRGRVRNWWYGELNWDSAKGEEFIRKRIEDLMAEK